MVLEVFVINLYYCIDSSLKLTNEHSYLCSSVCILNKHVFTQKNFKGHKKIYHLHISQSVYFFFIFSWKIGFETCSKFHESFVYAFFTIVVVYHQRNFLWTAAFFFEICIYIQGSIFPVVSVSKNCTIAFVLHTCNKKYW